MNTFPRAEHAPELLDEQHHDPLELAHSLGQVAAVNRWLGGARSLLVHLAPLLRADRTTHILDVGTGSADLPRRIVDHARARDRSVRITATDVHPQMRELAASACHAYPEITVGAADALSLPYDHDSFDVATLSLTLHHFDGEQQLRVLRELARVSRGTVIVNDLERNRLNYAGARLMALTLWRGNRLTRHDGPLSVRRAFTPAELYRLGTDAGMHGEVHRHFFQRLVFVGARNE